MGDRYDLSKLQDLYLEISKGRVPNHDRKTISAHHPSITTTEQTVWAEGGDVPLPQVTATTMTVSSTSANDAFPSGSGMTLVFIEGIDGNNKDASEVIVLDGTTPVITGLTYRHINAMTMAGSGSTGFNEGIIYIGTGTVTAGKPNVVYNLILDTDGASRAGFRLLSDEVYMIIIATNTSVNANKVATTRFCVHTQVGRICSVETHLQDIEGTGLPPSPPIPPGTFVEFRATIDSGSGELDINLGILLIHEMEIV